VISNSEEAGVSFYVLPFLMSKVIQISILGKVSRNVNADETIGNRTPIKKMYSSVNGNT
jgi:hypothetical protein